MILYFNGDSFTHGAELWEEANIPGYAKMTKKQALEAMNHRWDLGAARADLSYTGWFKKEYPQHTVINDGMSGSSQIAIVYRSITALAKLRAENPNERIVCVIQDTSPDRVWLFYKKFGWYCSHVLPECEKYHPDGIIAGLKMKEYYLDYYPAERLLFEHFLVTSSLKYTCQNLNIEFYHWRIWQAHYDAVNTDVLKLDHMKEDFFDSATCYPTDLVDLLQRDAHIAKDPLELPGGHFKIKWQPVLAQKINKFLIEKNVL
jgi:hypothetical protein